MGWRGSKKRSHFGRGRLPERDGTPNGNRPVTLKKSITLTTVGFFSLRTFSAAEESTTNKSQQIIFKICSRHRMADSFRLVQAVHER